ncbi:hypothetical protein [Methylomonas sp. TEB]|uniref:hypothetical protein n=1 Tax=Methylomonas sp. TEB TaxID=3398229 RepID=UPI0039F4DA4E
MENISGLQVDGRAEKYAYFVLMLLLYISMTGFYSVRYAFYLAPLPAILIWILGGKYSIGNRAAPFVILLLASLPSVYDLTFDTFKISYFIFVYAFVFSIFDFSKIQINFNKTIGVIILLFVIQIIIMGGVKKFNFSIANSESSFESTLAFPVGIIVLYFFLTKKYISFALSLLLCVLMLKRIVILALLVSIIPHFMGKKIRDLIINPLTVTIFASLAVFLTIELADGTFDSYIREYFDQSTNQLTKGRQQLWSTVLRALNFSYVDFIFYGVGQGKVTEVLDRAFHSENVLLHNDLLLLLMQFGGVVFFAFLYLFNKHGSINKRTLSLFITIIFFTDNVLIYQHVMVFYFLALSQIERQESYANNLRK